MRQSPLFLDAPLSLRPWVVITALIATLLITGWIEPNDRAPHAAVTATCQAAP